MIKKYSAITASELVRHPKKYLDLVEQGEVIYIIRSSLIRAKIEKIDFSKIEQEAVK